MACYTAARTRPIAELFWKRVDKADGCWLWNSEVGSSGYGMFRANGKKGKMLLAHRASWEIHNGPIPKGLQVLHKCDVKRCVNPAHLFLGTQTDNLRDMVSKGRHWMQTHPERIRRGTDASNASLTDAQAIEIKRRGGSEAYKDLAAEFGTSVKVVGRIYRRESWKHLP